MRACGPFVATVLSLCAHCQPASPDPNEQNAIIERMREAANSYTDRLQDFLCIQTTTREAGTTGNGKHWKRLETQELELSYVARQEHYRLLKVNGKSTDLQKRIKPGYFMPKFEFGTALRRIFDPKARAKFEWDHMEQDGPKPLHVFRYEVAKSTMSMVMAVDMDRVPLGHHGFVYVDGDTGMVMRIQLESEPGYVMRHGRQIRVGSKLDVRYGLTAIAGKEFLLPQTAEEIAIFDTTLTKAEIQFQQYRKYEANSTINFSDPDAKPELR